MKKAEKLGFAIGLCALVAVGGILKSSRRGGISSGTPAPVADPGGTPAGVPMASGTPKAEVPKIDAKLAEKIQKMSPVEIEDRMKEIDAEYFTEGMRDRLNSGAASAEERTQAKAVFAEKNALFARWAEVKIAKYDAAIKQIERHHAANVERAKGDFNETN